MLNVSVFVNAQEAEVELGELPLVFTRLIDKWEDFIGSEGTRAKPLSDILYLPATKRNNDILANFGNVDANALPAQGKLPIAVEVNGSRVFTGWAQRGVAQREGQHVVKYALRILGDSVDIMQQLDDVSLCDLSELGVFNGTSANILATWTNVADTDSTTVWQPVIYGGIWNEIFLVADTFTNRLGLRPAVRIWRIVEAIFERRFGYAIQGTFYQSEAFRNLLYLYGVGDDWERDDDIAPFVCFVGAQVQTYSSPTAFVKFTREAAPFYDAQGLNAFGNFEPNIVGWFRLEFFVQGSQSISSVKIQATYQYGAQQVSEIITTGAAGETIVIDELLFEPNFGLTRVSVIVEGNGLKTIFNTSSYNARLLRRYAHGAPLRIATCLHDRPVKDFLRGLQHMFGLVFAIDNLNKTVRIEPRFFNYTQTTTIPSTAGVLPYYDTQAAQAEELRADVSDVSIENRRPFGDYLTLGYADDNGDATLGEINEQLGEQFIVPLYAQKNIFIEAAKKGTDLKNPYFAPACNALLTQFAVPTASELQRRTQWICIADSTDEFKMYGSEGYTNPKYLPTRRSAPKIAVYYGLFDFSAPEYFQKYELGFRASLQSLSEVRTIFPVAFQVFPDDAGYWDILAGIPFHIPYATLQYSNPARATNYALGLIDRFHQKYLSAIYKDKFYSLRTGVKVAEYLRDYFEVPKLLNIGGAIRKCWQTSTQGFAPLESNTADVVLIEDADSEEGQTYTQEANTVVPALIIGGQITAVTEIPSFDIDALAFLLAAGITDPLIEEAVNTLVIDTKNAGLWTLMQAIYLMVGGTAFAHKFNLKDPQDLNTSFRLTFFGGWTHSAAGAQPNGINAYANTYYTPSLHAPAASNLHISYFSRTTSTGTYVEMGCNGFAGFLGAGQTYIAPSVGASSFRAVNVNGNSPGAAFNSAGFFIASRVNAASYKLYRNGAIIANDTPGLINNVSDQSISIGGRNNNGTTDAFTNRLCVGASIGYGLSDAQAAAWNTIMQNFNTTLGR